MDEVDVGFIKSWLFHVAKNLLIDHWRKASTRREVLEGKSGSLYVEPVDSVNIEKQCTDRQFLCDLLEELKEENPLWYEVIDWICIREETYEETAKHLGISPVVLRARLYRAKRFIREKYGKDYLDRG